jgi:small subunit ribosomal protein S9
MTPRIANPKTKAVDEPVHKKTAVLHPKKSDYIFAVGKRKSSIASLRLFLKKTDGKITINDKNYSDYFNYFELQQIVVAPLALLGLEGKYDITVKVAGGGIRSQAESVRHALTRTLLIVDPLYRKALRGAGFVTRDSRKKERKKPGLKRARRAPQWQKR